MDPSIHKPAKNRTLLIIAGALLVVGLLVAIILYFVLKPDGSATRNDTAKTLFYDTLENAAKQQKMRLATYRETFANKADASARKNIGAIASSVSEIDTEKGLFRSVFAHNLLSDDKTFSVGRCIDGVTYNDIYQPPALRTERAKTLAEATERLALIPRGNLFQVTEPLTYISCPHIGLLPGAPPIAVARLSDGLMPVTFTTEQAADWRKQSEAADLFEVKSEGLVERNGKHLRKISFKPKNEKTAVNQRLYQLFYETGEIAKLKERPNVEYAYEFQSINPNNSGSIEGYYLIDEATKLPVYSELVGTNPDKALDSSPAADRNIARTKQNYSFPSSLTLTLESPLEFLQ